MSGSQGTYKENKSRGPNMHEAQNLFFAPPPIFGASRGGKSLYCKFKTFGFLDIRHKNKILIRYTNT